MRNDTCGERNEKGERMSWVSRGGEISAEEQELLHGYNALDQILKG